MAPRPLIAALAVACAFSACRNPPGTPSPSPGNGAVQQITGNERLGWDQEADPAELPSVRFAIYVDGNRSEIGDASCGATAGTAGFPCSGSLPALSAGAHTLELSAFVVDGGNVFESERSAPLRVMVTGGSAVRRDEAPAGPTAAAAEDIPWHGTAITTTDGVRLWIEALATGLDAPADLAFGPGGCVFVAERAGRILTVAEDDATPRLSLVIEELATAGRGELLAIATDPAFEDNGFLYALYTAVTPAGDSFFRIARFEQAGDGFVARAVVLDDIRASPLPASAALRFGPDGRLYAAFDAGGDPRAVGDLASFNGKVLRLNPDGTTPSDQPAATPVHVVGLHSPRGIDWHPSSGVLWVSEESGRGANRLQAFAAERRPGRAIQRGSYDLPAPSPAGPLAFYKGDQPQELQDNLFVGAEDGILRLRLDPANATGIVSSERLLRDAGGKVSMVAAGPDGAIYFCAGDALGRLRRGTVSLSGGSAGVRSGTRGR